MPRNYTDLTIKTLFGAANQCAYPGCDEPLIFMDRGLGTVVAEIAHIRSESPDGPRHDPTFSGNVNAPENLVLLCGKHHRAVDRHEAAYTVAELETWKHRQAASADGGTRISDEDVRSYQRLDDHERESLRTIARLAQRLSDNVHLAQDAIEEVRQAAERTRVEAQLRTGVAYTVSDDGTYMPLRAELSWSQQQQWQLAEETARRERRPPVTGALGALHEEIAALCMSAASLEAAAGGVYEVAIQLAAAIGDQEAIRALDEARRLSVAHLWRLANGEVDER